MSKALDTQYYNRLYILIQFGSTCKKKVVGLLKRVCTVNVETVRIAGEKGKVKQDLFFTTTCPPWRIET